MATSPEPGLLDAPTVAVAGGRHAQGTWTPQVVAGSGGRRHRRPRPGHCVAEPATVAVTATAPPAGARRAERAPIRYAPLPGMPRRASLAVWGPPRPAGA